jgi:Cft2 family RNA processing exonuclease
MASRLIPISGCGTKGPACFLVNTSRGRIVLDLGYGPQPGLWPDISIVGRVDALLLSHTHADHAGALELRDRLGNPPVYATAIAAALLARGDVEGVLPLNGTTDICGIGVTTGRSGHAPGGVWLHLDVDGGLLYTGDYSVESDVYAYDPPPSARTLILDASYGAYDAPLDACRGALDALLDRGPLLLPVPPAGRAPDIALHVARRNEGLPFVDGAVRAMLKTLVGDCRDCLKPEALDDLETLAERAPLVENAEGAMLVASADASTGTASALVSAWEAAASPAIAFTGYVPPGTPADRLTRASRATIVRWNVHPRLSDNAALVERCGAKVVMPAFGHSKHYPSWRAAFEPADVVFEGPVVL